MRLFTMYDNGKEMAYHHTLSNDTGINLFLAARPCSPWERGINENAHRLLRRVLPKSTCLSVYTRAQLDTIALHHSAKPRKSRGCKSPAELLRPEGSFNL
jgi:IS30 family transposase